MRSFIQVYRENENLRGKKSLLIPKTRRHMFLEFKKAQTKAQHQGIAEHHRQKENNHSFQREETGLTKVKKHVVRGLLENY